MNKDLIFFGIQGSGKGTQAKKLMEILPTYKPFEPGALFRAITQSKETVGTYVKNIVDNGGHISDDIVNHLFAIYLEALQNDHNILLDGYPRTLGQMQYTLKELDAKGRDYICVYFDLSEEEAMKRLLKRAEIEGRADDTSEGIRNRFQRYYNEIKPMINEFEKLGKVIKVNADNDIETIFNELKEKLQIQ